MGTTRAAIYCRLSFAPDGSVEKVERQEADARRLAEQRGWDVVDVHTDNNESAWQRKRKRPGWRALLDGIQARLYDAVIVFHTDRLLRQPKDLEELLALADKQGITLASPHGSRDLDNPDDRFVLRIEVAQACREVDNISRRTARGYKARAEQGAPKTNGIRPYGWKRDGRTLDRHEAAVLRRAARQLIDGWSLAAVVADLNRRGEPTSAGNQWSIPTLKKVMANPRLIGQRTYKGKIIADGQWTPILTPDTFNAVKLALANRSAAYPYGGRHRSRKYLLSGLARCGVCGSPLYSQQRGTGRPGAPSYACRACRKVSRSQPRVDETVEKILLAYLERQTLPTPEPAQVDMHTAEIVALRDRIDATLAAFGEDDTMTPLELRKLLVPLKARLAELERADASYQVRRLPSVSGPNARRAWAKLDLRGRREIIADLVDVVIFPASDKRTWDADTIKVTPKR